MVSNHPVDKRNILILIQMSGYQVLYYDGECLGKDDVIDWVSILPKLCWIPIDEYYGFWTNYNTENINQFLVKGRFPNKLEPEMWKKMVKIAQQEAVEEYDATRGGRY